MNTNTRVGSNSGNSGAGFNISRNVSAPSTTASLATGWGAIILVIVLLMIVFAVYYQTIGYYFQLGWDNLGWSRDHHERIKIDGPGVSAWMDPAGGGGHGQGQGGGGGHGQGQGLVGSLERGVDKAVDRLETDVEKALGELGTGPDKKQVFNVNRNLYTFSEAEPLCKAFGAELATYDQVKDAYKSGADWCNYGWSKGQLALYPTQQSTFDKLQAGPEDERMSCGVPGVNGGFFPNEEQRFGVNCFGPRPAETALDRRLQKEEHSDFAYDKEVSKFRAERDSIAVSPWSQGQWSA